MGVTPREVRHVVALARLRLEEDEIETLTRELNGILEHVDALQAVESGDAEAGRVEPADPAPLRSDEPAADPLAFGPERLAPAWAEGFFTVPRLASHDDEELAPDPGPGAAP